MVAQRAQQVTSSASSSVGAERAGRADIGAAPESDRALAIETARALLIAAGYGLLLVLAGRVIG